MPFDKFLRLNIPNALPLRHPNFYPFMSVKTILDNLKHIEIISAEQSSVIETYENTKPFSVHWELRSILYLGILFFTGGLGVVIYDNIDSIGHQVIIGLIALLTILCFIYAFRNKNEFTWLEIESTNKLSEYALLLGCTAFLILEGYLQFQYQLFGNKYGLAVFLPTVLFFFFAYFFDHRGVLSMAITGMASWLGLTIAPLSLLSANDFTDVRLILAAVTLGTGLIAMGWLTMKMDLKAHFSFTYFFLGGNLAAIASLIGLFNEGSKILYFLFAIALSSFFIYYSRQKQALVFLLMGVIYGYVVVTYAIFNILPDEALSSLGISYFMLTSIGVVFFLLNVKKILRIKK